MTDVDPRDFKDFYLIRVSSRVFVETSMTEDVFDEEEYSLVYSTKVINDELHIEFSSEQGAEKLVDEWNYSLNAIRRGKLIIRSPYSNDGPDVDGVLMFQPRT